jgi:hypothetical protein
MSLTRWNSASRGSSYAALSISFSPGTSIGRRLKRVRGEGRPFFPGRPRLAEKHTEAPPFGNIHEPLQSNLEEMDETMQCLYETTLDDNFRCPATPSGRHRL